MKINFKMLVKYYKLIKQRISKLFTFNKKKFSQEPFLKEPFYCHSEGYETTSHGYAHVEGRETITYGECCHADGHQTASTGMYSHTEELSNSQNTRKRYNRIGNAFETEERIPKTIICRNCDRKNKKPSILDIDTQNKICELYFDHTLKEVSEILSLDFNTVSNFLYHHTNLRKNKNINSTINKVMELFYSEKSITEISEEVKLSKYYISKLINNKIRLINQLLLDGCTEEEIADSTNLSYQFIHKFHKKYKYGFYKPSTKKGMIIKLYNEGASISEILKSGIASQSYCYKVIDALNKECIKNE